jgi:hypothetical protein
MIQFVPNKGNKPGIVGVMPNRQLRSNRVPEAARTGIFINPNPNPSLIARDIPPSYPLQQSIIALNTVDFEILTVCYLELNTTDGKTNR